MTVSSTTLGLLSAALVAVAHPALAQSVPAVPPGPVQTVPPVSADPAPASADAFGQRSGIETNGLYSEYEVRGFSVAESGAYRIDGHYFARASGLPDQASDGVAVRIGATAVAFDLPSPSGLVDYHIRRPAPRNGGVVSLGMRDYETPFVDLLGSWRDGSGEFGVTGSLLARPDLDWGYGTTGHALNVGGTLQWRPDPNVNLQAFAVTYDRAYSGDYGILPVDDALPPEAIPRHPYSPPWARFEGQDWTLGVMSQVTKGDWTLDASLFRSMMLLERSDFTLIEATASGAATATLIYSSPEDTIADSAEVRLARAFGPETLPQAITVAVRARRSVADRPRSQPFALGTFDLTDADRAQPAQPDLPSLSPDGEDRVEQLGTSVSYRAVWNEVLEAKVGINGSRYTKRVSTATGPLSEREQTDLFYNASVIWTPVDRLSVFASYVTGLEEAGVAPQSASNRNEVMAPVEAVQKELGVRYRLSPDLNLLTAVFDVSKPVNGLRPDQVFGPVGEVRHRGLEASLAGRFGDRLDVVLGLMLLDPRVSGELVDAGEVGEVAAGLSRVRFSGTATYRLTDRFTLDAGVEHHGPRYLNPENTFEAPSVTLTRVGFRARLTKDERPVSMRVSVSNLFGVEGYFASASGFVTPVAPRTARLSVDFPF